MLDALVQRSEWQFCHFAQNTLVILIIEPCCVCLSVALPIEMCNWMSCLFAIIMCLFTLRLCVPKMFVCGNACRDFSICVSFLDVCFAYFLSLPLRLSALSVCVLGRHAHALEPRTMMQPCLSLNIPSLQMFLMDISAQKCDRWRGGAKTNMNQCTFAAFAVPRVIRE